MICGLPASGKSLFASTLGTGVLEYDSFAERLGSYADLLEEKEVVDRQFVLLAGSGRYGAIVDTFHTRAGRQELLEACGGASLVIVDTPLDVCLARNALRSSRIAEEELVQIAMQFEPILIDEGFSSIEIVKGW